MVLCIPGKSGVAKDDLELLLHLPGTVLESEKTLGHAPAYVYVVLEIECRLNPGLRS